MDNYDKALVAEFLEENYQAFKYFIISREFDDEDGKDTDAEGIADDILNQLRD